MRYTLRRGETVTPAKKVILVAFSALAITSAVIFTNPPFISAQSAIVEDWEKAAGGKMSFDVASVKRNLAGYPPEGPPPQSNFPLDSGDTYTLNGGLLSATNWPVYSYIGFAYKLTPRVLKFVTNELPKWGSADHFDVQARSQGSPTKDQMRLMMQAVLAERFKFASHIETRQTPVYNLTLAKPGQFGQKLQPHSDQFACSRIVDPSSSKQSQANDVAPVRTCGTMMLSLGSGRFRVDARGITLQQIAGYLQSTGNLDRPVVDRTNTPGVFDFTLEWTPEGPVSWNGQAVPLDQSGATFLEALKDQLGLKLDAATGPIDYLIVDHIEEPTPN